MSLTKELITDIILAADKKLNDGVYILYIIGGAATCLYSSKITTMDIDTGSTINSVLYDALKTSAQNLGIDLDINFSSVAEMPYNFEDRLVEMEIGSRHVKVIVPSPIDIILMKMTRGLEKDYQDSLSLVKNHNVKFEQLLKIFLEEMNYIIGDKNVVNSLFISFVELAYGKENSDLAKEKIIKNQNKNL